MAFFKKLKERLFKSSSKIDEGLEAIVSDGGEEETVDTAAIEAEAQAAAEAEAQAAAEAEAARVAAEEAALIEAEQAAAAEAEREAAEAAAREAAEREAVEQAEREAAAKAQWEAEEARRAAEAEAARQAAEQEAQEAAARAEAARAAEAAAEAAERAAQEAADQESLAQAQAAREAAAEAAREEQARAAQEQAARDAAEAERQAAEEAARQAEAERQAAEQAAREAAEAERQAAEEAAQQAEEERLAQAAKAEAEARLAQEVAEQAGAAARQAEDVAPAADEAPAAATNLRTTLTPVAPDLIDDTPAEPEKKRGLLGRLMGRAAPTTVVRRTLDDDMLEQLEELLITADMGVDTALRVTANMAEGRFGKKLSVAEIKELMASEIARIMEPVAKPLPLYPNTPQVVLVVGVNGSGKTTTIGKLASQFQAAGKKVVIAAGDTFRAAAVEQLQVWGERAGVPVLTAPQGTDPASLAFDALGQAQSDGADLLMIDTAGRLQNRGDLMEELAKIVRVIRKKDETAPHNTLLVLDATTGQNALNQVKVFQEISDVSGLVMTKLDGTAKGGVLVALADKFGLPIHAIGVGEQIDDLDAFDPQEFADALVGIER